MVNTENRSAIINFAAKKLFMPHPVKQTIVNTTGEK